MAEIDYWQDRHVKIMPDYYCEGVWHSDGTADDAESLPISADLVARLRVWSTNHDLWGRNAASVPEFTPEQVASLSTTGRAIAEDVKRELPDWTVIYWDIARAIPPFLDVETEIPLCVTYLLR